jgi:hypothetical protein
MANPFASSSSSAGSSSMMLPLMMMSMMQQPQAPAQAPQAPTGTPDMFKPQQGGGSFLGKTGVAPTSNQLGGKSLLGG